MILKDEKNILTKSQNFMFLIEIETLSVRFCFSINPRKVFKLMLDRWMCEHPLTVTTNEISRAYFLKPTIGSVRLETTIYWPWFIYRRTDILWIRIVAKIGLATWCYCLSSRTGELNPNKRQISKKEMRSIWSKDTNFCKENYFDSFNIKACKSVLAKWQLSRDCEIFQLFELHCGYFYNLSNVCGNHACLWFSKETVSYR